jgi:hypothetical protein
MVSQKYVEQLEDEYDKLRLNRDQILQFARGFADRFEELNVALRKVVELAPREGVSSEFAEAIVEAERVLQGR